MFSFSAECKERNNEYVLETNVGKYQSYTDLYQMFYVLEKHALLINRRVLKYHIVLSITVLQL